MYLASRASVTSTFANPGSGVLWTASLAYGPSKDLAESLMKGS